MYAKIRTSFRFAAMEAVGCRRTGGRVCNRLYVCTVFEYLCTLPTTGVAKRLEYETVYPYRRLCRGYRLLRLRACGFDRPRSGPESIGPVTVNRERIGTGQPFTATCVIPADGHNISSVEYNWSIRPVAAQAAVADVTRTSPVPPHVEEKQFTAPLTAGSYVIGCTARYIFGAPDAGGLCRRM